MAQLNARLQLIIQEHKTRLESQRDMTNDPIYFSDLCHMLTDVYFLLNDLKIGDVGTNINTITLSIPVYDSVREYREHHGGSNELTAIETTLRNRLPEFFGTTLEQWAQSQ